LDKGIYLCAILVFESYFTSQQQLVRSDMPSGKEDLYLSVSVI